MDKRTLKHQYGLTNYVLNRNLEGVDHAESLKSPALAGNQINWVVGHIARTRNMALQLVGKEPIAPMEKYAAYDDKALTDLSKAVSLDELLADINATQEPLIEGLEAVTEDHLTAPAPFSPTSNPDETIGSLLAGLAFHESYHTGQVGILRRVVGKEGAFKAPK